MTTPHRFSITPLAGTVNTRDLGGFMTRSGVRTRFGRVWRSDHVDRTTSEDRAKLAAAGVPAEAMELTLAFVDDAMLTSARRAARHLM